MHIHIELTEDELTTLAWMLAEHRNLCHAVPEKEKCRQIFDSLAKKFGLKDSEVYQEALAETENEDFWPLYRFEPPGELTQREDGVIKIEFEEVDTSKMLFFGDDEEVT